MKRLSGGAEGRGHGEFRRQWELRGQTDKQHAGALKTLQVTGSRRESSSSSNSKISQQSQKSTPALRSKPSESQREGSSSHKITSTLIHWAFVQCGRARRGLNNLRYGENVSCFDNFRVSCGRWKKLTIKLLHATIPRVLRGRNMFTCDCRS